jgi:DNA ligase 4
MPFHELFKSIFNPLSENKKKPTGPAVSRKKQGPLGNKLNPNEMRTSIIERFISRWRNEVGLDFYPAIRLIVPEKDRDRPMYGLKEKAIGKLLVKLLKLNPSSEDGFNLLNWKLPGQTTASRMAGDFAGRCYEVLSKRTMRNTVGNMRIAEVNAALDRLAAAQKEENQLPIFEEFYERMNAEELMWLIRMILRQMKVGATEKTFLNVSFPHSAIRNIY